MGSSEVMALVREAVKSGEVISDETAREIASWYHSPAEVDTPITALSHGCEFDGYALWERVSRLSDEIARQDEAGRTPAELRALKAWAESRMPRVVVVEYELDAQQWQQWSSQCGESDRERPEGVEPIDTDVSLVACAARDALADWMYPGDSGYPDKPTEHPGYDASDGSVLVPATDVEAAAAMLEGTHTGFYAGSYGGDPFDPGLYWHQSGRFDEIGAGKPYASRYEHPYNGTVRISLATLHGFTPEQEAEVWKLWKRQS